MSSESMATQFVVNIPEVGAFTFRKRNMATQLAVECEYARRTEGITLVTPFLGQMAAAYADLKVLTVHAPEDWDLDELDPSDLDEYGRLIKVWEALQAEEATFRQAKRGKASRQGDGGDVRAVVPPDVQAGAD